MELTIQSKNPNIIKEVNMKIRLDYLKDTVSLFKGYNDIIAELNKLLHKDAQIPQTKIEDFEFQQKIKFCQNLIKDKSPNQLDEFNQILKDSQKEKQQQFFLLKQLGKLFKDQNQLCDEIQKNLLPCEKNEEKVQVPKQVYLSYPKPFSSKYPQRLKPTINHPQIETNIEQTAQNLLVSKEISYPPAIKTDATLINTIQKHVGPQKFKFIIKLLNLYTECIISCYEFMETITSLFTDLAYVEMIKNLVESREVSRRKISQFKPLNDIDFQKEERITHSYVQASVFYPTYCSNSTPETREILNIKIISVPMGSEHTSFMIMRKNQWEDALFKSEDEKYEFDINMIHFKMVIKLLQKLQISDSHGKIIEEILKYRVISSLYKDQYEKIVDYLYLKPSETAPVVLNTVKLKLEQIKGIQKEKFRKNWHEVAEKNFHRSLDHRSFYFKKQDRKFIAANRFEKEPEFRYNILRNQIPKNFENKEDFEMDSTKFLKFTNTFEALTNIQQCHHFNEQKIEQFDLENIPDKSKLPLHIFGFENEKVCTDTFSILHYYVQNYAVANFTEKKKMKVVMKSILKGLFGMDTYNIVFNENLMNEQRIIGICQNIEQTIFDKTYAIYTLDPDKVENEMVQESDEEDNPKQHNSNKSDEEKHNQNTGKGSQDFSPNECKKENDSDLEDFFNQLTPGDEEQIKESVKEMNFKKDISMKESYFLPQPQDNQNVFYGTKHLYIFLRFFYTLYERILKSYELSNQFEANVKTGILSPLEKESIAQKRYETFKHILILSFKNKDSTKYEDFLRSLFGEHSFLLYTVDKVLTSTSKQLHNFINDELSKAMLEKYIKIDTNTHEMIIKKLLNKQDDIQFAKANRMVFEQKYSQERSLFRVLHDKQNQIVYINYFETVYNKWDKEKLEEVNQYFSSYCSNQAKIPDKIVKKIYLTRNQRKQGRKQQHLNYQKNDINYTTVQGGSKLCTYQTGREDVFVSRVKRQRRYLQCEEVFSITQKKIQLFNTWIEKKLKD